MNNVAPSARANTHDEMTKVRVPPSEATAACYHSVSASDSASVSASDYDYEITPTHPDCARRTPTESSRVARSAW
jgi:hypothetical protein